MVAPLTVDILFLIKVALARADTSTVVGERPFGLLEGIVTSKAGVLILAGKTIVTAHFTVSSIFLI